MALDPLATAADLDARGVDVAVSSATLDALLASASEAVRRAAGHPISEVSSTVDLDGPQNRTLYLPAPPVTAVSAVELDGEAFTCYRLLPGARLWRTDYRPWSYSEPTVVSVTYTHGYAAVPADVVDLVCGLVAGALSAVAAAYDPGIGVQSVKVDDASETYVTGAESRGGQMELPRATQEWLASAFSGGVYVASVVGRQ